MKHHQDSWSQRYNLNPRPPEYQAAVPTTWPKISVPEMVIANRNGISGVQKRNLGNDFETLCTNIYAQKCTNEIHGRCLGCLQRKRLLQKYSGLFHVRNKQLHLKCFAQSIVILQHL